MRWIYCGRIEKAWRASGSLDFERLKAVQGIYDTAGLNLFRASHPSYFEAVEAQRKLGLPLPLHLRVAPVAATAYEWRGALPPCLVGLRRAWGRAGSHFS